ncbi:MAG: phosphoserine phosphatase [Desulfatitalea sp. BRH_c12]|nr:MAG: phosphoserine phosphatase [Desulfatitalea sp. BRH_c12]
MHIVCSDLEGVLIPEIWIHVSRKTGIEELSLTTRDISDYDVLMRKRLSILKNHGLKLKDITDVIATMDPMDGAVEFIDWLRTQTQVIIVSDTYIEFAKPLIAKLGWPTLFCNALSIDANGAIADYHLRQPDGKRHVVKALQGLNFKIIAMGDSYNDISMLKSAEHGFLFRPPQNIVDEYPQFPVAYDYPTIRNALAKVLDQE